VFARAGVFGEINFGIQHHRLRLKVLFAMSSLYRLKCLASIKLKAPEEAQAVLANRLLLFTSRKNRFGRYRLLG
jgi:hypothetical protein